MPITVHKDVRVTMRDGVNLATDVYLPGDVAAPVLLVRLPYGKDMFASLGPALLPPPMSFVAAGYAVVWQDCRGMWNSDGEFILQAADAADGVDTVEWIRQQPWCDGNVGTYGASYLGMSQWATASQDPAGLKAIAPSIAPSDFRYLRYSPGGAIFWHTNLLWAMSINQMQALRSLRRGEGSMDAMTQAVVLASNPEPHLNKLPISDQPALNEQSSWWADSLQRPFADPYWAASAPSEKMSAVSTPGLHVGGWFDFFMPETTRAYTTLLRETANEVAKTHQRLIIGPWDHRNQEGLYEGRAFGPRAGALAADITGSHIRFFDHHVRGEAAADAADAPVRIFVMGIDQWRDEQAWPLPDTRYTSYFLDGAGEANTSGGDGSLTVDAPATDAVDVIRYDPMDPVPTVGGRSLPPGNIAAAALNAGPLDQQAIEQRADVLCYTTPVLTEPLEVTGEVSLVLNVSSSALDTDFTGKLVDVHPDGRALYLTDGLLRMRYRKSLLEPELLQPGQVYEVTIDLGPTSNVFLPGHRLRVEISSSNFPHYDRNTNTGGDIINDVAEPVVATNSVLHGPGHASRLILPIIDRA